MSKNALIVGAGIGGLSAALALRRAGWNVRVFERAPTPRELGFALLLAPNAMSALRELGLADALIERGVVVKKGEMRRPDGTKLRTLDADAVTARLGEPSVCALRPALHGALLDAVGQGTIELDRAVTGVATEGDSVSLSFERGERASGDLVVGADGLRSAIRKALHPDEGPPRSSGLYGLRGVAHDVAQHLGDLTGAQYFGRGIEVGVTRASADAVYWYLSLRAADLPSDRRDVAAVAEAATAHFHEPVRAIVAATKPENMRLDELFDRDLLAHWGRGRVTLLGDAAHPMVPHAGQGAAQAIEDAVTLGRVLAVAAREEDVEAALRRYEAVRTARTRAIVELARRNARVAATASPLGCFLRDVAIRAVPSSVILKALVAQGRPAEDLGGGGG